MRAQRVSFYPLGAQSHTYQQRRRHRPCRAHEQQQARIALALVEQRVERQQQQHSRAHAAHYAPYAHRLVIAAVEPAACHKYQYVKRYHEQRILWRIVFRAAPFDVFPQLFYQHKAAVGQQEVQQWHGNVLGYALHPCQRGAHPDGRLQQHVEQPCVLAAEVLAHEYGHGVVERVDVVHRPFARALTLVVDDARRGQVVVLPSGLLDAPREVYVLAVHEVALVQSAGLGVHLTAEHQESPRQYLYLVHLVLVQVPHVVGCEAFGVGEEPCQAAYLVERRRRRRKTALALTQVVALAVHHLHRQAAAVGVPGHKVGAAHKGVALHYGVGVEQQQHITCGLPQRHVVGLGEAYILVVLY